MNSTGASMHRKIHHVSFRIVVGVRRWHRGLLGLLLKQILICLCKEPIIAQTGESYLALRLFW